MQNLTKCPKRQYVVSRKLFNLPFRYDASKCGILKTGLTKISRDNGMNRLWLPVSYQTYKEIRKEFDAFQSVFLQNALGNSHQLSRLCNIRTFSTSSSSSSSNKNNADRGSSNGTTGDSDKDPKKSEEQKIMMHKVLLVLFTTMFLVFSLRRSLHNASPEITGLSWNEFLYHMLAKGEVREIVIKPLEGRVIVNLHDGAIIKGRRTSFTRYSLIVPDVRDFENKVRKAEKDLGIRVGEGVQIVYDRSEEYAAFFVQFAIIAIIAAIFFANRGFRNFPNPFNMFSQMTRAKFTLVEPLSSKGVRFEDVAGLKEAKIEVMEFIDYLKHPERYKTLGAKVPKGALLLGPPGCGKTLLAKAIATESNVPFLSMNGSEFIEMLGGLGAARVKDLFKEGKQRAPCIIYIDEIDAIGKKRSEQAIEFSNSESERTLNQLLVEMDGMTSHEDVIILASTNRAEVLDKALLRPGRFDRHILIDLPTLEERRQIFENHLRPLSLEGKPSKYSGYLAYLSPGFSGADIANVCNEAALHAARDKKTKVEGSDLMYAVDRTIGGPTKKNNSMTPSTKKVVAYHEAGHALVGWLLEHTDALLKVTIVPRTNLNLGFAQYSTSDQKLYSTEALFEKMCMMLGGRVAEYLTFDKISTGAENDLKKVTKIAYNQVQQFGMSSNIGLLSFDEEYTSTKTKKPYSKKLSNLMDAEVRRIIGEAYATTKKLLIDNKDKLEKVAEALLEKETLTYEDVEKLIGPPPFGKKRLVEPAEFEKSVPDIETHVPEPTPS